MAILDIKRAGDKVLKEIALPVEKIDKKLKQLLDNMADTMYAADGVGLAAPQVGVSLRVVVIDVGDGLIELINPVIIAKEGEEVGPEGCLSVPGVCGEVKRFASVTVEALNRQGKKVRYQGTGLLSRAFQHEIDHLDGILFIDIAESIMTSSKDDSNDK
ncbi:MAG: peptide deformylase [Sporomusaceae bacterium]|nr:peptide deformylase [Sporomusaceae bacterium]